VAELLDHLAIERHDDLVVLEPRSDGAP